MFVSIIIPMFNAEKTIARCINSILAQSYRNIEIVIVDDGSTDGSKKIVTDYQRKYKNILYYYQENMGVSGARNSGIVYAKGNLLSFVDSDDMLFPGAIEKMVCSQKKYHSDLVIGNHVYVDNGNYQPLNGVLEDELDVLDAARNTMQGKIKVGCCGKLFQKEFITKNGLFFPVDRYGEDVCFLFKVFSCDPIITIVSDEVYIVVNTENSICNSFSWKFIYLFDTLDMIKEILLDLKGWEILREDYYAYYFYTLSFLTRYGCRFYNRNFLKEVKKRNRLPKKYIRIVKDSGWKSWIDSLLFKTNLSLYCEVKMVINKVKKKTQGV